MIKPELNSHAPLGHVKPWSPGLDPTKHVKREMET